MLLKKLLYLSGMAFLFGILYVSVLGSHGLLERRTLEKKLKSLQEEVDRLEVENYTLTQRDRYLASEEGALASESVKNYFIGAESKLIKFKEVIWHNKQKERICMIRLKQITSTQTARFPEPPKRSLGTNRITVF